MEIEKPSKIQILVNIPGFLKQTTSFNVGLNSPITNLLRYIKYPYNTPIVYCNGKLIDHNKTFEENRVTNGSNLQIFGQLKGGGHKKFDYCCKLTKKKQQTND